MRDAQSVSILVAKGLRLSVAHATRILEDEKWCKWECTYFSDDKERVFHRFLDKNVTDM